MKNLFLIALIVLGFSAAAFAQPSVGVTATATSSATIITPIAIANAVDMNFGNVAVSGTGGTVILATDNSRSFTGGVTLPAVTGTVTAAQFNVSGVAAYTYSITLPSAPLTVTSGANTMTVTAFTSTPTTTGTLDGLGTQTIDVGATLNVTAGQAAGTYVSATPFDVTVNYN